MIYVGGIVWDRTKHETADSSGEGHWLSWQVAVAEYSMFWRDCSSSLAEDRLAEVEKGRTSVAYPRSKEVGGFHDLSLSGPSSLS